MTKLMRNASFILVVLLLQGCAAAVVGGYAAGGYYIAKTPRNAVAIEQDERINSEVKYRLLNDTKIRAHVISVNTHERKVTLSGHVKDIKMEQRAVKLAKAVKGVKVVVSRLRVSPKN